METQGATSRGRNHSSRILVGYYCVITVVVESPLVWVEAPSLVQGPEDLGTETDLQYCSSRLKYCIVTPRGQ